ncbi:hypothetical protein JOC33_002922 [Thalassobacillus pellis]|nr:hypothetical protein [Thalassobacillus pellis]
MEYFIFFNGAVANFTLKKGNRTITNFAPMPMYLICILENGKYFIYIPHLTQEIWHSYRHISGIHIQFKGLPMKRRKMNVEP